MTTHGDLLAWARERRDLGMARAASSAGEDFAAEAEAAVLDILDQCGEATGEQLVDAAKRLGVIPPNDRAFGPVIGRLSRLGKIEKRGFAPRVKGHATAGAVVWGIAR